MAQHRGLVAACATAIAILLAADAAAAVVVIRRNGVHTPRQLRKARPALVEFVEQHRGLAFKKDVDIYLLSEREFDESVSGTAVDPIRGYVESLSIVGFLKAMGLVANDFELSSLEDAGRRSLLGVYDPIKKRIVVRAELPEPLLHQVVVHELTHALDDQYHPLEEIVVDLRTEELRALQALNEGDATRIDSLFVEQLPPAQRAVVDGGVEGLPDIPASSKPFLQLLAFPYVAGPDFVRALVEHGGNAAVDEAFRTRPTTSEHLLHPDRFLRGAPPASVPQPAVDGELARLGVLGELGLRTILGETLDAAAAARAADGWGGDRFVTWSDKGKTCVRVNVRMDTPADANEVRDGFRQWAAKHPGTEVKVDGDLTAVTRCA